MKEKDILPHTIEVIRPLDPKVLARAMQKCRRFGPKTSTYWLSYVVSLLLGGMVGTGGIVLAFIVLRLGGASPHQQGVWGPFLGIVLAIAVLYSVKILRRRDMAEQFMSTPILRTLQRFDLSSNGLELASQLGLSRFDWSAVDRVLEDQSYLFCFLGPSVIVIPTGTLSTDQRAMLLKDIAVWRKQEGTA